MATSRVPLFDKDDKIVGYALIDETDLGRVMWYRWYLAAVGYPATHAFGGRLLYMHRHLLECSRDDGLEVDHINRNKLDNRRENLRIATRLLNNQNVSPRKRGTSKYRGVSWNKRRFRWEARAYCGGKRYSLGHHESELDAADAVAAFWAERGIDLGL